jgi:lipid A 3-O-deacylase
VIRVHPRAGPFVTHIGLLTAVALISTSAAWAKDSPHIIQFDKNAEMLEVRMGILSYDTGLFTTQERNGAVFNGEVVFPSPDFLDLIGSPRPYVGVDLAPADDQIDFFYAGLNWEAYLTDRLYLLASVGGAINNAQELINPVGYEALGCRAMFHLGAGVGFDISREFTVQLYADHFSNADLCSRNAGAEAAGARFGYRF